MEPLHTHTPSFLLGVNFYCLSCQFVSISPLSHKPTPLSLAFLWCLIVSQGASCRVTQRCSLFTWLLIDCVLYCGFLSAWATYHHFISLFIIVICFPLDEPRCAWENKGEYPVATTCCALHAPSLNFARNILSVKTARKLNLATLDMAASTCCYRPFTMALLFAMSDKWLDTNSRTTGAEPPDFANVTAARPSLQPHGEAHGQQTGARLCHRSGRDVVMLMRSVHPDKGKSSMLCHSGPQLQVSVDFETIASSSPNAECMSVVECLCTLLQRWKWGWYDDLWLCISLVSQRFWIVHVFFWSCFYICLFIEL